MNFRQESRKLADAMGAEHAAMGSLLEVVAETAANTLEIQVARKTHEEVRFQRARVEAAVGEKA